MLFLLFYKNDIILNLCIIVKIPLRKKSDFLFHYVLHTHYSVFAVHYCHDMYILSNLSTRSMSLTNIMSIEFSNKFERTICFHKESHIALKAASSPEGSQAADRLPQVKPASCCYVIIVFLHQGKQVQIDNVFHIPDKSTFIFKTYRSRQS